MALASTGGAPPSAWLDTLGKVAGVILGIELIVVLLIICGLMVGLVLALRWLNMHVVPVLHENAPKAQHVMDLTQQNTDRVVGGVAEFYGRRQGVQTGLRVLLFGRQSAKRAHEESLIQAATDLDLMETDPTAVHEVEGGASTRSGDRDTANAANDHTHRDGQNGHHAPDDEFAGILGNAG